MVVALKPLEILLRKNVALMLLLWQMLGKELYQDITKLKAKTGDVQMIKDRDNVMVTDQTPVIQVIEQGKLSAEEEYMAQDNTVGKEKRRSRVKFTGQKRSRGRKYQTQCLEDKHDGKICIEICIEMHKDRIYKYVKHKKLIVNSIKRWQAKYKGPYDKGREMTPTMISDHK